MKDVVLLAAILYPLCWLGHLEALLDKYLACCHPHERFGTYVWHTHTFWRWRWLATHTVLGNGQDYREMIRWTELREDDIQARVIPAGSRWVQ